MSDEQQLRHLLLLFIVLFQAKHLSVKAGEDLLAFLSFFVRALGHGMEIPTVVNIVTVGGKMVPMFLICNFKALYLWNYKW
ncbi:hypothetical protein G6F49_013853 [Rhizopus delemar]|nr:hypothetical protein G6F49_013853 [Rhizopus delemar]KAG1568606.1 hypothetical protein G6F48_013660 [Rhizopus delemar]KAG1607276.1 hypothetical protein G6F44_013791 [Rhizopus delemar]